MYQGAVDDIPEYFGSRGHPLPPKYNPADWIMNVAQSIPIDQLNENGFFPNDDRQLPEPFVGKMEGKDELGITITGRHAAPDFDERQVGLPVQVSMLFSREIKNIGRDKAAIGARFGLTIFLSLLVGIIFLDVGAEDSENPAVRTLYF